MSQCYSHLGRRKKSYRSQAKADAVVLDAKLATALHGSRRRTEKRSYLCPTCGRWHTTSAKPKAKYNVRSNVRSQVGTTDTMALSVQ